MEETAGISNLENTRSFKYILRHLLDIQSGSSKYNLRVKDKDVGCNYTLENNQ